MFDAVIFTNKYFEIFDEADQYYIRVFSKGYDIKDLASDLKQLPQMEVTEFLMLKSIFNNANGSIHKIGNKKPRLDFKVSTDHMSAYIKLNYTDDEFKGLDKKQVLTDIIAMIEEKGIISSINLKDIVENLVNNKDLLIAEGIKPVHGEDAIVAYYEIQEPQPKLYEDGQINHYELELINKVEKGDWVGQRIEPTPGICGKTVLGEVVTTQPGHQQPLIYDKTTIDEDLDDARGITTLRAKRKGAVTVENGIISVSNYLEIDGKVSFSTGNIDFDGFVDVKDTIEDNFSVIAEHDIQIMGALGLGAVEAIESKQGNIYIRGGISGKNKAKIVCDGDLFTKFASECDIECKGTVHIGYYAMNCNIRAKEVILESSKSRIIGGQITVDTKVIAAEIGSKNEIRTIINVNGYDRFEFKEKLKQIEEALSLYKDKATALKQKINIYRSKAIGDETYGEKLKELLEKDRQLNKNMSTLHENAKRINAMLKTRGEGEVRVTKKHHGNVHLKMKDEFTVLGASNLPISYYLLNNEIRKD